MISRILPVTAAAFLLAGCANMQSATHSMEAANRPSLKAAREALDEGSAATALGIAKGVLSVEPHNPAALVQAGDAQVALDNRRDAEKSYHDALAFAPGYAPAKLGLAKLKLRDDVKGAETDLRSILADEPRNASALTDLGVALDLQERHTEAQAEYAKAITLNPDLTSPRVNLAVSLALSGDAMRAEGLLHDAANSGTASPRVRADYALAQVLAGHADAAKATLASDLTEDEAKQSVDMMSALAPAAPAAVKK